MDDIEVKQGVTIPGWELWMTTSTSGGPGGQHANKAETRVTIHWDLAGTQSLTDNQRARVKKQLSSHVTQEGVLQVSCGDTRSQHRNRKLAREQMAELVRKGIKRPKRRKKTRRSRASNRRRLRNKRHRGRIKKLRKPPKRDDW